MGDRAAVSVITRSFLPEARVLAESFAEHHPGRRLSVVVVDDPNSTVADEPFDVLSPIDVGLDEREWHRRALLFDAQGLISSLRSVAISYLLDRGASSVLLLDADMIVLAPLDDLWELAEVHEVLLTPHVLEPAPRPEHLYLVAGAYNGGFLGVGQRARPFLEWLMGRVRRDCAHDPARGLLYSQTWLNLVPGMFPHHVLRDPGVNVTGHRLSGADLTHPVRLFHFTGVDHVTPAQPVLAELCRTHAQHVRAHTTAEPTEYIWNRLPNGRVVDGALRDRFRAALESAEAGVGKEPPDPYVEPDAFLAAVGAPALPEDPQTTIVVQTRNRLLKVRRALSSVGSDEERHEIVVVDGGSRWLTRTYLRALSRLRRIDHLVLNDRVVSDEDVLQQVSRYTHPESRRVVRRGVVR